MSEQEKKEFDLKKMLEDRMIAAEAEVVLLGLKICDNNRTELAKRLRITRRTLAKMFVRLRDKGIKIPEPTMGRPN